MEESMAEKIPLPMTVNRNHHQYSARVARSLKSPYFRKHCLIASRKLIMGWVWGIAGFSIGGLLN